MGEIEKQIAELTDRAEAFLKDGNDNKYNVLMERVAQLQAELLQLQEVEIKSREEVSQVRAEVFAQYLDELQTQIQAMDLLGKIIPEKPFASVIGLTEYGEMRQELNKIMYAWVTEVQTKVEDRTKEEIVSLNVKIQALTKQWMEVEGLLAQEKAASLQKDETIAQLTEEKNQAIDEAQKIKMVKAQDDADKARLAAEIEQMKIHEQDLHMQIANAPAPSARVIDITPSQNVQETIKATSNKADEWIARFNARQKREEDKIPLTNIELPALVMEVQPIGESFRVEDTQTNVGDNQILAPQVDEVNHFREEVRHVEGLDASDTTKIVQPTIEERVKALEIAVFGVVMDVA